MEQQIAYAMSGRGKTYLVTCIGPNRYHAESGNFWMNCLFGYCAQYYEFEVQVIDERHVTVHSIVCCGGFSGGICGVIMNDAETERVKRKLAQAVFPNGAKKPHSSAMERTATQKPESAKASTNYPYE